jgi:hypothetical protein
VLDCTSQPPSPFVIVTGKRVDATISFGLGILDPLCHSRFDLETLVGVPA